MTLDHGIRLRLILDDASKHREDKSTAPVWNPEGILDGYLEISTTEELSVDKVTVYFEGLESIN